MAGCVATGSSRRWPPTAAAVQELESKLALVAKSLQAAHAAIAEKIDGAERLTQTIEEHVNAPETTSDDSVRLEHQVLAEHWKQFREK